MTDETKFCVCCGEDVPYNRITRDGNLEFTCTYCGFVLDTAPTASSPPAECVITADDSPFIRNLLKDLLEKNRLAETVIAAENGQEFMSAFNRRMAEKKPVTLAILDLEMPVMDGIKAAQIMRSLESKYQAARIPILFFSARKCDDALKEKLRHFGPARYVNKGTSNDPGDLADRVDQLVNYLLAKRKEKRD